LFQACRLAATFFFGAIDFVRVQVLGRSYTWWNWLIFQEHREHVLVAAYSGARMGEVAMLTKEDCQQRDGIWGALSCWHMGKHNRRRHQARHCKPPVLMAT